MSDGVVMSGLALRAAVRIAESPGGGVVKARFVADLRFDELFALDLREWDPEPASMPLHPANDRDDTTRDDL